MTAAEKRELARLKAAEAEAVRLQRLHESRAFRAMQRLNDASDARYAFEKAHGLLRVPMPGAVNLARAEDIYRKLYAKLPEQGGRLPR